MKTRKNYNDLGVKLAVQYMNEDVRYNTPKPTITGSNAKVSERPRKIIEGFRRTNNSSIDAAECTTIIISTIFGTAS